MNYELFYLVGQNNEEKIGDIKRDVEKIFTDEGARFGEMEVINKRKFSYEIKHQVRGTYIAKRFEMPENDYWSADSDGAGNDAMQKIVTKMNLFHDILRYIIVKADELPELKQKEAIAPKEEVAKRERKEKSFAKKEESKPEKKREESIDEKLEEILNI